MYKTEKIFTYHKVKTILINSKQITSRSIYVTKGEKKDESGIRFNQSLWPYKDESRKIIQKVKIAVFNTGLGWIFDLRGRQRYFFLCVVFKNNIHARINYD